MMEHGSYSGRMLGLMLGKGSGMVVICSLLGGKLIFLNIL